MRPIRFAVLALLVGFPAVHAAEAPPAPAPSATAAATADAELDALVAKARASYPAAKQRFAQGLPRGEQFVVLAELSDGTNAGYVPLRVRTIIGTTIKAKVWARTDLKGFAYGQDVDVEEGAILDWRIVKADGSVDGDIVGALLAERERRRAAGTPAKP